MLYHYILIGLFLLLIVFLFFTSIFWLRIDLKSFQASLQKRLPVKGFFIAMLLIFLCFILFILIFSGKGHELVLSFSGFRPLSYKFVGFISLMVVLIIISILTTFTQKNRK